MPGVGLHFHFFADSNQFRLTKIFFDYQQMYLRKFSHQIQGHFVLMLMEYCNQIKPGFYRILMYFQVAA